MPDQYTEVTKTSWGSRLGGSFSGIFFGILLFLGSFALLFWNEGRVGQAETAKEATEISAVSLQADGPDGELVAAGGELTTEDSIGDGQFLQNGPYLSVRRNVEMYAWVETSSSKTETKLGGSQETVTTYDYKKKWVSSVPDSSNFKVTEGHSNPSKKYENANSTAPTAQVGVYSVDPSKLKLPGSNTLPLTAENVSLPADGELVQGKYIYIGGFSMDDPVVGDVRISYSVVPSGKDVTVFGKLSGDKIVPYIGKKGTTMYEAREGGFEESVLAMEKEHTMSLWLLRVLGFFMMWIGLKMILAPLSVLLDVLPILGHISRGAVGLVTGLLSIVLTIVTILVSMLLHNIYAVIVAALLAAGVVIFFWKKKQNNSPTPDAKA